MSVDSDSGKTTAIPLKSVYTKRGKVLYSTILPFYHLAHKTMVITEYSITTGKLIQWHHHEYQVVEFGNRDLLF